MCAVATVVAALWWLLASATGRCRCGTCAAGDVYLWSGCVEVCALLSRIGDAFDQKGSYNVKICENCVITIDTDARSILARAEATAA